MTTEAQTPAVRIQQQESFSEVTERDWLRWIGLAMAVIGIGVGAYLSYTKLSDTDVICTSSGSIDCAGVQDSVYSEIAGVPIALLGLGAYVTIFG
ncbi:MAG: hypothetical protein GYB66_02905, partial [Chloroflexi bacterium]|nr:hypothetical protein [Chloroflexota bacterium]